MAQPTADSIQLTPKIAKLHEQITQHLTQGQFGNQIAHLSDKSFSAETSLQQAQNNDATQVLTASLDLQQSQHSAAAQRQAQSHYQKAA